MNGPEQTGEKLAQDRAERIRQVVSEFRSRYERGEALLVDAIIAEHQDLMPELGKELKKVCLVLNAGDEALARKWSEACTRMGEDTIVSHPDGSTSGASNDAAPTRPLPDTGGRQNLPEHIGKYRVIGRLASGGQAIAYRAVDDTLRRDVVVKVSRGAIHRAGEWEHLFKEGEILVRVGQQNHRNLARVLDWGFDEDRPFLVMEYIGGPNLAQYSRDTRLSPREAAALVAKIARALAAAHRCGVIHRDIKPHNIIVDQDGEPWLIDFGLALLSDAWQPESIRRGQVSGTAAYMAPEQARGEEADIRSDVFGLGAVLYFLLTGERPFSGASVAEAVERAKRCDFDRQALNRPAVGRGLRKICLKAMAPDREGRYQTAEEMARALERWLALRKKSHWTVAAAAVFLLAVAVGGYLLAPRRLAGMASGAAQSAPLPVQAASAQAADAEIHVIVWQNDVPRPLDQAVPLRTGDDLRIECRVPEGLSGALFWLDAGGQLYELPLQVMSEPTPQELFTRLVWPEPDQANVLAPPPGTEVVLVCAGEQAPSKDEVAALVGTGQPWPELPDRLVVEFDRASVRVGAEPVTRGPGGEYRKRPVGAVLERAEMLRRRLSERFPVFSGVAFPHLEAADPAP